jgi:hypothetical protein
LFGGGGLPRMHEFFATDARMIFLFLNGLLHEFFATDARMIFLFCDLFNSFIQVYLENFFAWI